MNKLGLFTLALLTFTTTPAFAAEPAAAVTAEVDGPPPASTGFELGFSNGLAKGFGDIALGMPIEELQGSGTAMEINVGYRINPQLMLGTYMNLALYGAGTDVPEDLDAYGMSAGVQANWHFAPEGRWDPWLGLGTGWRGMWTTLNNDTTSRHGWDVVRLRMGVDYRWSEMIAFGPVVGADVTVFFTESVDLEGWRNISNPEATTFLYGAWITRFDVD